MVPIYKVGGSFSSTKVPTLKKWAALLNTQLHLNFPEALTKIQDVFAKLASGKKNSAKIQNTAKIQPDASQCEVLDSGKKARGASKSRLVNSSTITTTTNTTSLPPPPLLTSSTSFPITARSGLRLRRTSNTLASKKPWTYS